MTEALFNEYGWVRFKPGQRSVIEAILQGRDALAVLPTAGGKSLCYQLPALIKGGLVVVISPLVALMENQVLVLKEKGIKALALHSGLNSDQRKDVLHQMQDETLRLLYLAPERLLINSTRDLLLKKSNKGQVVAIAIDEAHCISAWGHEFRPVYRRIGEIRDLCPDVPIVALSATASPKVRADIIRLLKLRSPFIQVCSARRNNLSYTMQRRSVNPLPEILHLLKFSRGASLIYARTRSSVERWTSLLQSVGVPAIKYHAGLDSVARTNALEYFLREQKPVLVATVAFGMGVDRGDVGLVLHLNMPSSPERYLQESGRAGRDGLPAKCVVYYSPGDRIKLGWAIRTGGKNSYKKDTQKDVRVDPRESFAMDQLRLMEEVAEGNVCIEQALLLAVGELVPSCGNCDRCKYSTNRRDWSQQALLLLSELEQKKWDEIRSSLETQQKAGVDAIQPWTWLARRLVQEELIGETNDGSPRFFLLARGRRFINQPWPLKYVS